MTPALSAGGSSVLAVWSDGRANSAGGYYGETSRDIYAMRFDSQGAPLQVVPFVVTAARASQQIPRAAWNGTSWLVVFETTTEGGTGYFDTGLAAVRVSAEGSVLDAAPIPIWGMKPVSGTWGVASDGSGWVVAGQGSQTGGDLVAVRIAGTGAVLDPAAKILVPETYYLRGQTRLAYAAGVYLLAYEESMTGSDPTQAIRFDAALNPLDAAPFGLAPAPLAALASNGSGFYAVWTAQQPDYTNAVMGSRIGTNGQKLDGSGVKLSGTNPPDPYGSTSVVWDGSQWKATWASSGVLRVARIASSGAVLDPGGIAVSGPESGPTASAGNGSLQVAWTASASSEDDTWTAHVNASNVAGANRPLSTGAPAQGPSDVAAGAGGWLVAYRSATSTTVRMLAQKLDAAGNPSSAEPIVVASGDPLSLRGGPAVAWNGSVFLFTWSTQDTVYARRLAADGAPIDPAPIAVMTTAFGPPDVEALGSDFLVVGYRCGYTCQYINPIARRVRGIDGSLPDPSPIGIFGTYSSSARITTLGGRWLVVYQDNVSHDDPMAATAGVFIDGNGVKAPEFTVHAYYSTAGGNGIFSIGLASNGSVALVAQSQELTSGVENDLLVRRIFADGTVSPYANVTPWIGNQYRPRVCWDGARFVLVFQDQKARVALNTLDALDARGDLFGMRVGADGSVLDPQGFLFSNSASGEAFPTAASAGGTTLVLGSIVRQEAPFVNYRIGYELFGAGGNAWPVAMVSANPTEGNVPISVGFSSAGSFDPDGTIATYAWDFGDGATSSAANPSHAYTVGGPYVATLRVTDAAGAASWQEVLVQAVEPNRPPVAFAASNLASGAAPLDVTFLATGSYDPDGFIGNFRWTFSDDGAEYWGATAYHTFYTPGTWQVTLTVFDRFNAAGSASLSVTVGQPAPPAAPSNLVTVPFTTDWINMTWTDNANSETGFLVQRCQGTASACSANPSLFLDLAQTGSNIDYYGDTGLPAGTTYTYRVRAFNGSGNSGWSNTSTATTLSVLPAAPTSLTARAGSTGNGKNKVPYVDLTWVDNAANETSYIVERCAGSSCTNFAVRTTLGANTTTFRDTSVAKRTAYRYRVKARNASGDSGYSNVAGATTP
ncbi:MAG TPA: PKD domain-containing protein [Candidatus Polarisedimenticolaceae bacterium]